MNLIKRSIEICFLSSLTISGALAKVYSLYFTLTTLYLVFVYLSNVRKCVAIKTEHEIKERDVAFVIFNHKHFYCISVKYDVCMHVKCFHPNVAISCEEKKRKKLGLLQLLYINFPLLLIFGMNKNIFSL